ncbi:MAG: hypothetical protein U0X74_12250 [Anaerolineales bacterium]
MEKKVNQPRLRTTPKERAIATLIEKEKLIKMDSKSKRAAGLSFF